MDKDRQADDPRHRRRHHHHHHHHHLDRVMMAAGHRLMLGMPYP